MAVAGLFLMASDAQVWGQAKKPAAPPPEVQLRAAPEAQPADGNKPAPLTWISRCASDSRQGTLDCAVEQSVLESKSRQLLLQVVVRVPPDTHKPVLTLQLPLGLYLPAGASLQFDESKPQKFEIQSCDPKGCYVNAPVTPEMLGNMSKGKTLSVTFETVNKQNLAIPVQLTGFATAYQKIQ